MFEYKVAVANEASQIEKAIQEVSKEGFRVIQILQHGNRTFAVMERELPVPQKASKTSHPEQVEDKDDTPGEEKLTSKVE